MANHLFEVNKTARKMIKRGTQDFRTIIEKLLLLYKQASPNILTAVVFLTMRVKYPEKYDNKKLGHILKFLSGMRDFVLTLESDRTITVKR